MPETTTNNSGVRRIGLILNFGGGRKTHSKHYTYHTYKEYVECNESYVLIDIEEEDLRGPSKNHSPSKNYDTSQTKHFYFFSLHQHKHYTLFLFCSGNNRTTSRPI